MPLPTITSVTLTGDFRDLLGDPQSGTLVVQANCAWSIPGQDIVVVRKRLKASVGTDGILSLPGLPVVNDPQGSVAFQYEMTFYPDDGADVIGPVTVEIPATSTDPVKYEDLVPVPAAPPVTGPVYATVQYVNDLIAAVEGGEGVIPGYTHTQSVASTVWTIVHNLGWDPAGIQVFDANGDEIMGGVVTYMVAGTTVRIAFDIPISGIARLT